MTQDQVDYIILSVYGTCLLSDISSFSETVSANRKLSNQVIISRLGMLRDFIGTTLALAVTTDPNFTGGRYSVIFFEELDSFFGERFLDSENLSLIQTMFCFIVQLYSRIDSTNPYPIPDTPSVNPQFPDKWNPILHQNSLISIPYPRLSWVKAIPFTEAHTYIA